MALTINIVLHKHVIDGVMEMEGKVNVDKGHKNGKRKTRINKKTHKKEK